MTSDLTLYPKNIVTSSKSLRKKNGKPINQSDKTLKAFKDVMQMQLLVNIK